MHSKRKWRLRLLSLLFGLSLAMVLSEVGLRILGVGYPQFYQPDEHCGSRLRPGISGVWTAEGFGRVSVNSLGFRGPEIKATQLSSATRVAVLGDSFIEALQVDHEECFCARLEESLNSKNHTVNNYYEVINCGVSGYGTAQQLLMLRNYVLPLRPDIVLLAVYPENDIRNNHPILEDDPRLPYFALEGGELVLDNSFRDSTAYLLASGWYEQWKATWVNRSRVLQVLRHVLHRRSLDQPSAPRPSIETQLSSAVHDADYAYSAPDTEDEKQAWEVTERLIEEVAAICRTEQIRLSVFSVSTSLQVYPNRDLRQRVAEACAVDNLFFSEQRLQSHCTAHGIEFIPLASHLQSFADQTGEYLHGFTNTQLGLGHWSVAGHQAAATHVAEYLGSSETGVARDMILPQPILRETR